MPLRIFATMTLVIALIEMSMRSAPVATESVTTAEAQALGSAISPFELTLKNIRPLPDAYHGGDYAHVYRNR